MSEKFNLQQEDAIEKITKEFFKRRFPEKDIEFEKKCGYFGEWENRFRSGNPMGAMDSQSIGVWMKMRDEGWGKLLKDRQREDKCTCEDPTIGYCPEHDGDYGKWKYGEHGEEWDE